MEIFSKEEKGKAFPRKAERQQHQRQHSPMNQLTKNLGLSKKMIKEISKGQVGWWLL